MKNESQNCQPADCGCSPTNHQLDSSRRHFLLAASTMVAAGLSAGPLRAAAQEQNKSYVDVINADPDLRGYWRFDGDLVDARVKAPPVFLLDSPTLSKASEQQE